MNSNLVEKMQRAISSKNAIKQAIINKGVDVGDVFDEYASAIDSIQTGGGAELNIHYGLEAPEDTTKLWVKTDKTPSKVSIVKNIKGGNVGMNSFISNLPLGMFGIACGVVGTKIYLFGGQNNKTTYNTIYVYDIENNTIETLSTTLLVSASYIACGVVGTKIYLFGGYKTSNSFDNSIYMFDTETNTITKVSILNSYYYKMACGVVGTKIYLFGGYKHQGSTSIIRLIQIFDTESNTVTVLNTTLPNATHSIACGVVGDKCYLFGGYDDETYYNDINVFDTTTNTISTLSETLPYATHSIACGVVGTKIYLFGGYRSNYPRYLNKINYFDTESNTVTVLNTTLPNATHSIACGVVGDKCYLFGGYSDESPYYLDTINQFVISITLNQNNVLLLQDFTKTPFKLINSEETEVEVSIGQAYIGNANNEGDLIKCAIYNGTEWEEIN